MGISGIYKMVNFSFFHNLYLLIFIIVTVLFMPYGQYEYVFVDRDGNLIIIIIITTLNYTFFYKFLAW